MRMKYYPASLYVGVNEILHRAQDINNLTDAEEEAVELKEAIQDEQWEENNRKYREFCETAPQIVRDFYNELGSLHDAGFTILG